MKIKKIVDISMLLEEDIPSDPEPQIPRIQRMDHKMTASQMGQFFAGATELSAQAVRELCRMGGAHIWCESDDTFFAGNGIIALHTALTEGERTVRLPAPKALVAWPTGEHLYTDTLTVPTGALTGLWIEAERYGE